MKHFLKIVIIYVVATVAFYNTAIAATIENDVNYYNEFDLTLIDKDTGLLPSQDAKVAVGFVAFAGVKLWSDSQGKENISDTGALQYTLLNGSADAKAGYELRVPLSINIEPLWYKISWEHRNILTLIAPYMHIDPDMLEMLLEGNIPLSGFFTDTKLPLKLYDKMYAATFPVPGFSDYVSLGAGISTDFLLELLYKGKMDTNYGVIENGSPLTLTSAPDILTIESAYQQTASPNLAVTVRPSITVTAFGIDFDLISLAGGSLDQTFRTPSIGSIPLTPKTTSKTTTLMTQGSEPPLVNVTAPLQGETVSGAYTVSANATDNNGISKVEFYIDNEKQFIDASLPYSWTWNTTDYSNGSYNLRARAYDLSGEIGMSTTITVTVSNSAASGGNNAPNVPSALAQYKSDGVTGMAAGATTNERTIAMKGTVSDPDNDSVSLEVEIKNVGTSFSNSPSSNCASSGFATSGGTAAVTCSGLADGQYKWQGRAKDSKGAYSTQWTDAGYTGDVADIIVSAGTTTVNNPPTVIVISPNGSETWTAGSSYTIKWSAIDDTGTIDKVEIYLSTNGGVSWSPNPINTNTTNMGVYTWTPTSTTTQGRIKVVATDSGGAQGVAVNGGNFSILSSCAKPSTPTLNSISPYGSSYTVSWSASSGATSYTLQQESSSSFTNPSSVYSSTGTSWYSTEKANGTYYYRVKAANSCGDSSWSGTQSATIQVNQAPGTITALSPADGATNQSLNNITLSWSATHSSGEGMKYNVFVCQCDTDTYFTNNIKSYNQAATSFSLSNLPYNKTISWGIQAIDDTGDINYSPMFHFKTIGDSSAPTGSILINNGASSTDSYGVTLNFSASDSDSGVEYMRLSNDGVNWTFWTFYSATYAWNIADEKYGGKTGQTTYTVYAQFRDKQDNESVVYSDTISKATGKPGNIILNGKYYETIQDAIDAANSGETVYLTEGYFTVVSSVKSPRFPSTYVGVLLKDGVSLVGAGAGKTTVVMSDSSRYTIIDGHNSVIEGMTIINQYTAGMPTAVLIESNSSVVKNCVIKGSYQGVYIGNISGRSPSNTVISNNIFSGNTDAMRVLEGTNISILNNTIASNNLAGIAGVMTGLTIKNNIIAFNGIGMGTDGSMPVFQNNDVYGNVQGSYNENYQNISDQTGINGNISSNPSFVNSTSGDYRLNSGSPVIDKGTNVGIAYNGSAPDMGAFEYNGTGTIQVTSNRTDAAFSITGPSGTYTGSGASWSQSSLPIGIYTITFTPIADLYSPPHQSKMLYTGQTLTFDGTYPADNVPPTGKMSVNFDEYATADNLVTLTFDLTDEVAGISAGAQMMFSNDGATWSTAETYSSIKKDWDLTLYGGNTTSGTKTLYAKVSDSLGNWATLTDTILYVPNRQVLEVPTQYSTIQSALDAAQDGDMVYVLSGEYTEGTVSLPLKLKAGVKLQGAGADKTIIKGYLNPADNSMIDGFTFKQSWRAVGGTNVKFMISNCVFLTSSGIMISHNDTSYARTVLRNNVFNNSQFGIYVSGGAEAIIENNTIMSSSFTSGSSPTLGVVLSNATPNTRIYLRNNIVANNGIGVIDYGTSDTVHKHIFASFNTYWNNTNNFSNPSAGYSSIYNAFEAGDMSADPMFVDSANGDFHLKAGSSSIGSGDPDARFNDPDGTRNDRGAYGGPSLNTPPKADFSIPALTAISGTTFTFDAGLSHDGESKDEKLQVRWDFDGDGTYDTSFAADKITTHTYDTIGDFNVTLQVKDDKGYLSTATKAASVVNQPPNIPATSIPADGSNSGITPILSWTGGDPDYSDTVTYDVYFGTSSNPPLISSGQTETYFSPGTLLSGSVYYWRVIATDNHGSITTGPVWYFVTEHVDIDSPFGAISISNGVAYTNSTSVTLTLSCSDESGCAEMQVSNDGISWSSAEAYSTLKAWTLTSGDGTKTVYVKFKDGAGNWSTAYSDTLVLDTTAPTVGIGINSGAPFTSNTSVNLTLSTSDTNGVSQMMISNDGVFEVWETYATSKAWTISSGDGTKTVYVKFKDNAANWSSIYSDTIVLDTTAPTTTATPAGSTYTSSQSVTLTCSDGTGSGCDKIYYTTDGTTPTTASTVYSTAISISATKTLRFFAKDLAGNSETVKSEAYTIDTTAPTGTISINSGATSTNSTSATLTLSCTDTNGCSQMQFSNDNSTWSTAEAYTTSKAWTLSSGDGTKTVYVKFKDVAGNWSTAYSDTIVLDTTAPTTTASPAGGTYNSTQSVTLTCSDGTGSGCDKIYYTTDGTTPTTASTVYSTAVSISATKTLKFFAKDLAGNSETVKSEAYTIDTVSPVLTLSTLSDGSVTNNNTLNISGTATDNTGIQGLTINGNAVTVNTDGSFSHALILNEGANIITTVATDLAGNETTDTRTITLDTTAPALVIDTPADNSKTAISVSTITGTINENSIVAVTLNSGTPQYASVTGNTFTTELVLSSGVNTIEVTATDLAGNTSTQKRTVTYDNTKPSLTITDPAQDIWTNQGSIIVKGTVSDALTAVSVTVTVDGNIYTPMLTNGQFEQTVTFATEKTYTVTVTATDEVGNTTTAQRNIIYDITQPVINFTTTTPTNNASQAVIGTMEEGATVTVTSVTATVGTVTYPSSTTWRVNVTGMTEGSNTITATAKDTAGNETTVAKQIVVDTVAPVTTASPGGGAYTSTQTVTLVASETATIRYTVDGTIPTTSSPVYNVPITVAGSTVLSFFATDAAGNAEGVKTLAYSINPVAAIDATPPANPSSLNSTSNRDGSISLSWTAPTDADLKGYNVHRDGTKINASLVTTSRYTDTNTVTGSSYTYKITSLDLAGNESSGVTKTATSSVQLNTPPAMPGNIKVEDTGTGYSLNVVWSSNTESDLAGYKVYWGTASGTYTNSQNVGNITAYEITGLTQGTRYYVAVSAYDTDGNESMKSIESTGTPKAYASRPDPATGLTVTPGNGYLTFSWTGVSNITGYMVYIGEADGVYGTPVRTANTTYTFQNLTNGKTYYVAVSSYDLSTGSRYTVSSESERTTSSGAPYDNEPPAVPSNLSATDTGTSGSISLKWDREESFDIAGYMIAYKVSGTSAFTGMQSIGIGWSHTITGLDNGKNYTFNVYAYDAAGNFSDPASSQATPTVSVSTVDLTPPDVPILSAVPGNGKVTLIISSTGNDAVRYNLYVYNLASGKYMSLASISGLSYEHSTGVDNGKALVFVATAVDAAGNESGYSETASVVPNELPGDIPLEEDPPVLDRVDGYDVNEIAKGFGSGIGNPNYNPNSDLDGNGKIDGDDLMILGTNHGKKK